MSRPPPHTPLTATIVLLLRSALVAKAHTHNTINALLMFAMDMFITFSLIGNLCLAALAILLLLLLLHIVSVHTLTRTHTTANTLRMAILLPLLHIVSVHK